MKPITWHMTKHGDRVFAAKVSNGALHSGTISKTGRSRVRVQFDDNGASYRPYNEVYSAREVFEGIKLGALRAKVEVQ